MTFYELPDGHRLVRYGNKVPIGCERVEDVQVVRPVAPQTERVPWHETRGREHASGAGTIVNVGAYTDRVPTVATRNSSIIEADSEGMVEVLVDVPDTSQPEPGDEGSTWAHEPAWPDEPTEDAPDTGQPEPRETGKGRH